MSVPARTISRMTHAVGRRDDLEHVAGDRHEVARFTVHIRDFEFQRDHAVITPFVTLAVLFVSIIPHLGKDALG